MLKPALKPNERPSFFSPSQVWGKKKEGYYRQKSRVRVGFQQSVAKPEVQMVKFPEAEARLFRNKFACKKCKSVVRAPSSKVMSGKISCKRCGGKNFRPLRKK